MLIFGHKKRVFIDKEDMFFMSIISLWLVLSLITGRFFGIPLYDAWIHLYLITTNIWFYIGYFFLKQYRRYRYFTVEEIIDITIIVITMLSIMYLVLLSIYILGYYSKFADSLGAMNLMAYYSLFVVVLVLFFKKKNGWGEFFAFSVNSSMPFFHHSRGATELMAVILIMKLLSIKPIRKIIAVFVIISVSLFSIVHSDKIMDRAKEIVAMNTVGIDFDRVKTNKELRQYPDEYKSAYSRNKTNVLCLEAFLSSPLWGVGYDTVSDTRVLGYMSHSYFIFPLVSYGLIGFVPYLLFFWKKFGAVYRRSRLRALISFVYIAGVMTFVNDFRTYYAILLFVISNYQYSHFKHRQKNVNEADSLRA
jgi:hypothetical protein